MEQQVPTRGEHQIYTHSLRNACLFTLTIIGGPPSIHHSLDQFPGNPSVDQGRTSLWECASDTKGRTNGSGPPGEIGRLPFWPPRLQGAMFRQALGSVRSSTIFDTGSHGQRIPSLRGTWSDVHFSIQTSPQQIDTCNKFGPPDITSCGQSHVGQKADAIARTTGSAREMWKSRIPAVDHVSKMKKFASNAKTMCAPVAVAISICPSFFVMSRL